METVELISREYDRIAPIYEMRPWADFWRLNEIPAMMQILRERVDHGNKLLDAGCATGMYMPYIAHTEAVYHGVDISLPMVILARAKILPFSEASICQGSLSELPYRDGMFDAILVSKVLSHYSNVIEILLEILRVVRHGGYIFLCDVHRAHMKPYSVFKTHDGTEMGRVRNYLRDPIEDTQILKSLCCTIIESSTVSLENAKWKPDQKGPLGDLWLSPSAPILYIICVRKGDGKVE